MFIRLTANQRVWGAVSGIIVTGTAFKVCKIVASKRIVIFGRMKWIDFNFLFSCGLLSYLLPPDFLLSLLPGCHGRIVRKITRRCDGTLPGGPRIRQVVCWGQGQEKRVPSGADARTTATNEKLPSHHAGIPRLQSGFGPWSDHWQTQDVNNGKIDMIDGVCVGDCVFLYP